MATMVEIDVYKPGLLRVKEKLIGSFQGTTEDAVKFFLKLPDVNKLLTSKGWNDEGFYTAYFEKFLNIFLNDPNGNEIFLTTEDEQPHLTIKKPKNYVFFRIVRKNVTRVKVKPEIDTEPEKLNRNPTRKTFGQTKGGKRKKTRRSRKV